MPAPSALFASLVDYAGLFPPAKLAMIDAVRNHAGYLEGPQAERLGRFVLPLSRLAEFETAHASLPPSSGKGWALSVLGGDEPAADVAIISKFNSQQLSVRIVSVEIKIDAPADIVHRTTGYPPDLEIWIEGPARDDVSSFIAAVKAAHCHAKIRIGGITADAFPVASKVAGFLTACRDARVACKATAGLHHPLSGRYQLTDEPDSPGAGMFGFLNLFLAAALLHGAGTLADATALLEETEAGSFTVSASAIAWRGHSFSSSQISASRQALCRSFGSCSFLAPIESLKQLRWL